MLFCILEGSGNYSLLSLVLTLNVNSDATTIDGYQKIC